MKFENETKTNHSGCSGEREMPISTCPAPFNPQARFSSFRSAHFARRFFPVPDSECQRWLGANPNQSRFPVPTTCEDLRRALLRRKDVRTCRLKLGCCPGAAALRGGRWMQVRCWVRSAFHQSRWWRGRERKLSEPKPANVSLEPRGAKYLQKKGGKGTEQGRVKHRWFISKWGWKESPEKLKRQELRCEIPQSDHLLEHLSPSSRLQAGASSSCVAL